jgi:dynein heavy chain 2
MIESIPESDNPKFFGLPLNIDRSSQTVISNQVVSQLKVLQRSGTQTGKKLEKDTLKAQFKPLWKLWEALKKV